MALTLGLMLFGFFNIQLVIRKNKWFTNALLGLFYLFAQLTLIMRFAFYIFVICQDSYQANNPLDTTCDHEWMVVTLQDLPDYLYLVSGLC